MLTKKNKGIGLMNRKSHRNQSSCTNSPKDVVPYSTSPKNMLGQPLLNHNSSLNCIQI